jgi:hypothetical protein
MIVLYVGIGAIAGALLTMAWVIHNLEAEE